MPPRIEEPGSPQYTTRWEIPMKIDEQSLPVELAQVDKCFSVRSRPRMALSGAVEADQGEGSS
ncbi:hypothetical protein QQ25_27455 [Mycolicibacterium setense]|uniref:Uncharacterized protein n=1 Tax=Mycolicibacterium setense TaxID=431269 RepID=A0ABR4YN53_9MYCO|nr:hypothetical protein QQ25_27455 [Mycolicibacterium setense]KHO19676.1 hypothetical protein QQ44_23640 [Mycolicibacterium setense]